MATKQSDGVTAERRDVTELHRWTAGQSGLGYVPGYCPGCLDKSTWAANKPPPGALIVTTGLLERRHPRCAEILDGMVAA